MKHVGTRGNAKDIASQEQLGAVFDPASPGAIGGTTPSTVTATKLTATNGTVTTNSPVASLSQTFNAGAVAFTGVNIAITKTAAAASSAAMKVSVNGAVKFAVSTEEINTGSVCIPVASNTGGGLAGGVPGAVQPLDTIGALRVFSQGYYHAQGPRFYVAYDHVGVPSSAPIGWAPGIDASANLNLSFVPNASGAIELNNGTLGSLRDLSLRNILGTGNLATGVVTKTAAYTATTNDHTILVNASAGAVPITGFACAANAGKRLTIKKIDSSANAVTFDPNAAETVDGASTKATSTQYAGFTVQVNDGATAWHVVATF